MPTLTYDDCVNAGDHLIGTDHRWQECPTMHDEED